MLKKLFVIFLACFIFLDLRVVQANKVENIKFELGEDEAVLTFFHLSKGEAALLQDGFGHSILLNTGHASSKREVLEMLSLFQVKKLDAIIVTKQDEGYDDNLGQLSEQFYPKVIHVPAGYTRPVPFRQVVRWEKGNQTFIGKDLTITVLNEENEKIPSIDLSIKYGENHILYMTNRSVHTEEYLMKANLKNVNVLKMPQVSKGEALSEKLVEHIDPQTAIFTASNKYHLDQPFIEHLYDLWIDLYFVQQMGTVSVKMNKVRYEVIKVPISEGE
jgi:competence protein ComEC